MCLSVYTVQQLPVFLVLGLGCVQKARVAVIWPEGMCHESSAACVGVTCWLCCLLGCTGLGVAGLCVVFVCGFYFASCFYKAVYEF